MDARARSAGVLAPSELASFQSDGTALAFDPMQQGWVPADCDDDLTFVHHNAISSDFAPTKRVAPKQHFTLRAWGSSDVDAYIALLDDPDVWWFLPEDYPSPISHDLAIALIELSNASNHHQVFAVEREGSPVGQVRLEYDVEPNNPASAEISYWLGQAHWGKGIGSDMVNLFTARCLRDNPGLTSLIARVHKDNVASLRALTKAGYAVESADATRADWVKLRLVRD